MALIYVSKNTHASGDEIEKSDSPTEKATLPAPSSPLSPLYDIVFLFTALGIDSHLFMVEPWLFWSIRRITNESDTYDVNYVLISSLVSLCLASHIPKMHHFRSLDRWTSRTYFISTHILALGFLRAYLPQTLNSILMGASLGYILGFNNAELSFALTDQMDQLTANLIVALVCTGLKWLFFFGLTAALGTAHMLRALKALNPLNVNLVAIIKNPDIQDAPMLAMLGFHLLGLLLPLCLPRFWGHVWYGMGLPIRSCMRYGDSSAPHLSQKPMRYLTVISETIGLPKDTPFAARSAASRSATPGKTIVYVNLSLAVHSAFLMLVLLSTAWAQIGY